MRIVIFFVIFTLCVTATYAGDKIRVTFLNPSFEDNDFWGTTTAFMQATAHDLGMEVKVYYADSNRYNLIKFVEQEVNSSEKPDYFIMNYMRGQTVKILAIAESAGIKTFLFNTDIYAKDRDILGQPREKLKYWIGHMFPDDRQAGYDLGDILIRTAQERKLYDNTGTINILGISGSRDSTAALFRNEGLELAVKDLNQNLKPIFFAEWNKESAAKISFASIKRYPEVSIIWSASDLMSLGAIDGIKKSGKISGKDILTGGVDWMPDALNAISSGEMTASVGGHFMEGGWTLVMLYDYHHGIDFAVSEGLQIKSRMGVIHQGNIQDYQKRFASRDWDQIDFTKFSKVYNPDLKNYNFSLEEIFNQLK